MSILNCPRCGGTLRPDAADPARLECLTCGKVVTTEAAAQSEQALRRVLGEADAAKIHNLRANLYAAVTAEYISREEVQNACDAIRRYLPDDFLAGFFKVASGGNLRALNRAIGAIDADAHLEDVGLIIEFLVASMTEDEDCLLALSDLVERAYKQRNLKQYNHYATLVSEMAEKVISGVYETTLPRDVFVAYSSKDMAEVMELVEELEEQGFFCFVAARNLRHGVGSVENYERALGEAMENCLTVVFVSTMHSRSFACDALKIELAYVRQRDLSTAPPQYQNNYAAMPHAFKKPRVEYRVEESARPTAADRKVDEFFAGYERVYTPADVADRVADQIFNGTNAIMEGFGGTATVPQTPVQTPVQTPAPPPPPPAPKPAPFSVPAVGGTFKFGSYEQNPGRGKEPIEWIVLANEGKRALLISKYILDCQQYHPQYTAITWENCSLRKWLNSTFLNTAFNATERGRILASRIKNPKNAKHGTNGGNDTTDHIFCLSIDEANQYFASDAARAAKATPAIKAKGKIYVDDDTGNSWWWLRSPGYDSVFAANVDYCGGVNSYGRGVYFEDPGVRPAFWINLES